MGENNENTLDDVVDEIRDVYNEVSNAGTNIDSTLENLRSDANEKLDKLTSLMEKLLNKEVNVKVDAIAINPPYYSGKGEDAGMVKVNLANKDSKKFMKAIEQAQYEEEELTLDDVITSINDLNNKIEEVDKSIYKLNEDMNDNMKKIIELLEEKI